MNSQSLRKRGGGAGWFQLGVSPEEAAGCAGTESLKIDGVPLVVSVGGRPVDSW